MRCLLNVPSLDLQPTEKHGGIDEFTRESCKSQCVEELEEGLKWVFMNSNWQPVVSQH
jgi:hypothetical protein